MKIRKTQQSASVIAQVNDSYSTSKTNTYSCDYINKINNYSTEEQVVGKWIDGKPIYRKVVEGTLPSFVPGSSTAEGSIAHSISNLGTVVGITGWLVYSDTQFPFPILSSNGKITAIKTVTSTNVVIRSSDNWIAGPPVKLIIEYTKNN